MRSVRPKRPAPEPAPEPAVEKAESPGALTELFERLTGAHEQHQRLLTELGATERRFRSLARRVWQVQEDERRRVARELHDGLGQTLTALKNELERLASSTAPVASERIAAAAEIAGEALASTRELSRLLRPAILDDLGLAPALRWLARTIGERAAFAVELELPDDERRLPPEVETLLFRASQEALTNALKHSGTSAARLVVERQRRKVSLAVSDRGRGCDPEQALTAGGSGRSLGMRSLRDRVELHGGRLEIDSSPGAGFRLTIELPLEEEEKA